MTASLLSTWPPVRAVLRVGEVHVWVAGRRSEDGQQRLDHLVSILSPDERLHADRFHFARDRHRYVATRVALRLLIGRYLRIPASDVRFAYGCRGKPSLQTSEAGAKDLRFNVSHSGGLALMAFAWGRELGVDIECERPIPDWEAIAERCFSTRERAILARLSAAERQHVFFRYWTRKEALIKATGDGLSRPLDSFDVSFAPDEPAQLCNRGDLGESARWWLEDLHPVSGFAAAIVMDGQPTRIMCLQYGDSLEAAGGPSS